jgi:tRNA pseudouridine32 synthase/23S rRNA pseudouridine746 synthase
MSTPAAPVVPPALDGIGPSSTVLPPGDWPTVLAFMAHQFAAISESAWLERMAQGKVIDAFGQPITANRLYQPLLRVYYYRSVPNEPRIPFEAVILFQDEHLIVVDKPHFLPVMPSGGYLQETVLVRLKRQLGLDALVPIHRIDRDTAGLVMFSVQPRTRGAYAALFRERALQKTYEAIAPWNPALNLPLTRESRLEEAGHFMLQHEVNGPPNAITHVDVAEVSANGTLARYRLRPVTGQRHQLRVHMAALGLPILGDGLYPVLTPEGQIDYEHPLQLLAKSIEFTDPVTSQPRHFVSARGLQALTCFGHLGGAVGAGSSLA